MVLEDFLIGNIEEGSTKKAIMKDEKNILKLERSYNYWIYNLLEKCMRIFEWKNLPFDQKEIEMRVLTDGWTGFVNDALCGYSVSRGSMNGITQYVGTYLNFLYAGPVFKGKNCRIGKEATICNNTAMRTSIIPMVKRYASLLAHAELSVKCSLISLRENEIFSVEDDKTKENVLLFHKKLYEGEPDVIIDKSLVNAIQDISKNHGTQNTSTMQAWDIRVEILRSFFNEIGVKWGNTAKKERMNVAEVNDSSMMLLLNVNDMLKCRQQFCEETNRVFGLNISVDLSPEFDILTEMQTPDEGGNEDEN